MSKTAQNGSSFGVGLELRESLQRSPGDPALHEAAVRWIEEDAGDGVSGSPEGMAALGDIVATLLQHDWVDHGRLRVPASTLLVDRFASLSSGSELVEAVAADGLAHQVLRSVPGADLRLERRLSDIRSTLLRVWHSSHEWSESWMRLAATLAIQGTLNQYVMSVNGEEDTLVAEAICRARSKGDGDARALAMLVVAMYRPVVDLAEEFGWIDDPPPVTRSLGWWPVAVDEPVAIRREGRDIAALGSALDAVTHRMQAQYEDYPYPPWRVLGCGEGPLRQHIGKLTSKHVGPPDGARILVPGGGTGRQPLYLARENPTAHVWAVDLSRSSLGYGRLRARELGISNVTFVQGDLMAVDRLGLTFHHVDCEGVLHHLVDPEAGFRALTDVLEPGGTMRVGIYSAVARLPIRLAQQVRDRLQLRPTLDNMRAFRRAVQAEAFHPEVLKLIANPEFFTMNTVRDMFFNENERCFTLSEVHAVVAALNLDFLGFVLERSQRRRYLTKFPEDPQCTSFDNWRAFEHEYTGTGAMFRFWVAKPQLR